MTDIAERLRKQAWQRSGASKMNAGHTKMLEWEAADEIERLRVLVRSIAAIDEDFIKTVATVRGLRLHLLNLRSDARQFLGEP